jgi:hypothetical protein
MQKALDSLHVGYDTLFSLPFEYNRYASIFMVLGTANTGNHALTDDEGAGLAAYLLQGGNLYMESYFTWYYLEKTALHPMFRYTSKKVPAYFYPDVAGVAGTFADSLSFVYTAPMSYAVFDFVPVAPAFATLVNDDSSPKTLEIASEDANYKTIGSMLDFSALDGVTPASSGVSRMHRYLDFFDLNISGPFPLFHTVSTSVCLGQLVSFTDDSFSNIVSRSWEFPGGTPAFSNDSAPVVRYDAAGRFDVKLTVSDGHSTRSVLKQEYIRAGQCTGYGDFTASAESFRIYPNPAGDRATVEVSSTVSGSFSLVLFDLSGRKVMESAHSVQDGRRVGLDLSGLVRGVYFLRLQAGGFVSTRKLIRN